MSALGKYKQWSDAVPAAAPYVSEDNTTKGKQESLQRMLQVALQSYVDTIFFSDKTKSTEFAQKSFEKVVDIVSSCIQLASKNNGIKELVSDALVEFRDKLTFSSGEFGANILNDLYKSLQRDNRRSIVAIAANDLRREAVAHPGVKLFAAPNTLASVIIQAQVFGDSKYEVGKRVGVSTKINNAIFDISLYYFYSFMNRSDAEKSVSWKFKATSATIDLARAIAFNSSGSDSIDQRGLLEAEKLFFSTSSAAESKAKFNPGLSSLDFEQEKTVNEILNPPPAFGQDRGQTQGTSTRRQGTGTQTRLGPQN